MPQRNARLSSSDEDDDLPRKVQSCSRIPQDRLKRVLSSAANEPNEVLARRRDAPSKPAVPLHSRIDAVERMAQVLQRKHVDSISARLSFQQRGARPALSPSCHVVSAAASLAADAVEAASSLQPSESMADDVDDELAAACGLHVTTHMQSLLEDATPPRGCASEVEVSYTTYESGIARPVLLIALTLHRRRSGLPSKRLCNLSPRANNSNL